MGLLVSSYSNPAYGAPIYYFLKEKPKGELKIEILDRRGTVIRTLSSVAREPDYSSEDQDPEDFRKAALPVEPGVQRAVWNLAYEGARKIHNGKIDTGNPTHGPLAVPDGYTVRLTVDGRTLTAPLKVVAEPGGASQGDLRHSLRSASASVTQSHGSAVSSTPCAACANNCRRERRRWRPADPRMASMDC